MEKVSYLSPSNMMPVNESDARAFMRLFSKLCERKAPDFKLVMPEMVSRSIHFEAIRTLSDYFIIQIDFWLNWPQKLLQANVELILIQDGLGEKSINWTVVDDIPLILQKDETTSEFLERCVRSATTTHETMLSRLGVPPEKAATYAKSAVA